MTKTKALLSMSEAITLFLANGGKPADIQSAIPDTIAKMGRIESWCQGLSLPTGERAIRLNVFLDERGFTPGTFQHLPEQLKVVARCLTHNIITLQQAQDIIGVATDTFWRAMNGERPLSNRRLQQVTPKTNELSEQLKAQVVAPVVKIEAQLGHSVVITILAHLVNGALPLARLVAGDDFSSTERRELRRLTNATGIFDLSNTLNQLCGEEARRSIQKKEAHHD